MKGCKTHACPIRDPSPLWDAHDLLCSLQQVDRLAPTSVAAVETLGLSLGAFAGRRLAPGNIHVQPSDADDYVARGDAAMNSILPREYWLEGSLCCPSYPCLCSMKLRISGAQLLQSVVSAAPAGQGQFLDAYPQNEGIKPAQDAVTCYVMLQRSAA